MYWKHITHARTRACTYTDHRTFQVSAVRWVGGAKPWRPVPLATMGVAASFKYTRARAIRFPEVLCFSLIKKMLGRTETRTRDRMCFQMIWIVWDISRDDRARIATCSLLTSTDRFKENYSIDKALTKGKLLSFYDRHKSWCFCDSIGRLK